MDFELVVLQTIAPFKRRLKLLREDYARFAQCPALPGAPSYAATRYFEMLLAKSDEIDDYVSYLTLVFNAFKDIPDLLHRKLLYLSYIKKMQRADISAKLGIPERTIYRRLGEARQKFKRNLEKAGITREWLRDNFGDLEVPDFTTRGKHTD